MTPSPILPPPEVIEEITKAHFNFLHGVRSDRSAKLNRNAMQAALSSAAFQAWLVKLRAQARYDPYEQATALE